MIQIEGQSMPFVQGKVSFRGSDSPQKFVNKMVV